MKCKITRFCRRDSNLVTISEGGYRCETCKKKFKRSDILDRHMKVIHSISAAEDGTNSCEYCMKVFTRSDTLRRHIRDIHENFNISPAVCEMCKKFFKNNKSLERHKTRCPKYV